MLVTPLPRLARKQLPWWLVDLIIAVLLLSSAFLPFDIPGRSGSNLASLPWLAVASATLLLRRRWPVVVLGISIAIFAAASITGVVSPAFVIAPAISIFHVALTHSRRVTIWTTAATAIALPVLSLIAVPAALLQPQIFISAQALQLAAIVAFAGAFGDATRSRRATLSALEERALRAEQTRDSEAGRRVAEDRLQIARDLHDLIAHQIAVINLHANVASRSVPDRPTEAKASLAVIRQASRTVLTEIGDLLSALRDTNGLPPAPTNAGLAQLDSLVEQFRSNGLAVTVSRTGSDFALGEFADVVAYKVIQEALTNALKHSPDRTCKLSLTGSADKLVMVIENPQTPQRPRNCRPRNHGHARTGRDRRRISPSAHRGVLQPHGHHPVRDERGHGMISVVIADDQQLIRSAIRELIAQEPDLTLTAEATDGAGAISVAESERPDVILMDIRMPGVDGIEATRQICSDPALAAVRVLILTTFEEDDYIVQALQAGASGFIGKGTDAHDLMRAIRIVHQGETLLSPTATRSLIDRYILGRGPTPAHAKSVSALTSREVEVLTMVGSGLSNQEIAQELTISPTTTKTHVNRIMMKLSAHDRAQLVIYAYESGLVSPSGA